MCTDIVTFSARQSGVSLFVLALLTAGPSWGGTCYNDHNFWIDPGGGAFAASSNWSLNEPPGHFECASWAIDSTYTVTFAPSNFEVSIHADVRHGDVTWQMFNATYELRDQLTIGDIAGSNAKLTVINGTVKERYLGPGDNLDVIIGEDVGATGELTVSTLATIDNVGTLRVGDRGTGTLNIVNGGVFTPHQSNDFVIGENGTGNGTVNIDGAGSLLESNGIFLVGLYGTGTLSVRNGGLLDTAGPDTTLVFIGAESTITAGTGTVTVENAGSRWDNSNETLEVGVFGSGTLNIRDGGRVDSQSVLVGRSVHGGTVNVDDAGSLLDVSTLTIGDWGTGTLNITNGGTVSASSTNLGTGDANGVGIATVTGANSELSTSSLTVGDKSDSAYSTLTVSDQGQVTSNRGYIGRQADSLGRVTVTDQYSRWDNAYDLNIGEAGTGELNVNANTTVTSEDVHLGVNDTGHGVVSVSGANSLLDVSNTLTVGRFGSGDLSVSGGANISASDVYIGEMTDSSGSVSVTGAGSELEVGVNLGVGSAGYGELSLTHDAEIFSTHVWLGDGPDGQGVATVDGQGSRWINDQTFIVGNRNTATTSTLTISNNGVVGTDTTRVGVDGGNGQVTITDSASLHSTNLSVGENGLGNVSVQSVGRIQGDQITIGAINGTGTLDVMTGGRVSGIEGRVGLSGGSDGTVTINGENSYWTITGDLVVAGLGEGTINVESEGYLASDTAIIGSAATGLGDVTVIGVGSVWDISKELTVGFEATGSGSTAGGILTVQNGGLVQSQNSTVGLNNGSTGFVEVGGGDWQAYQLTVGQAGSGEVLVHSGGLLTSSSVIGDTVSGFGQVTVRDGGTWTDNSTLVGHHGEGYFYVESGGSVTSNSFSTVGVEGNSIGRVRVEGVDGESDLRSTWTVDNSLTIGAVGNGRMTISDGALVESGTGFGDDPPDAFVGRYADGEGRVSIYGADWGYDATWHVHESLYIGGDRTGPGGEGTVFVGEDGQLIVDGTIKVWNDGVLELEDGTIDTAALDLDGGELVGTGNIMADLSNITGGELRPGGSPGRLLINGNYLQDASSLLEIELGGLIPESEYDVLEILGSAILDGELYVEFYEDFIFSTGDTFDVLFADEIIGTFADIFMPELDSGLFWEIEYDLNLSGIDTLRLSVSAETVPIPGAVWLFGSALGVLGWLRRRQND